jgi:hypothetical protein
MGAMEPENPAGDDAVVIVDPVLGDVVLTKDQKAKLDEVKLSGSLDAMLVTNGIADELEDQASRAILKQLGAKFLVGVTWEFSFPTPDTYTLAISYVPLREGV